MAFDAHKNLAISVVATAPSPAASGTTLVITAGEASRFPAVPFNATVWKASEIPSPANAEIVRVTAISTNTFTITRAQEGTTARAIVPGDLIAATVTAKTLTDVETQAALLAAANTFTATQTIANTWPRLTLLDTAQSADQRRFQLANVGQTLHLQGLNDAETVASGSLQFSRAGRLQITGDYVEQSRTTPLGHWINVPSNPGNFSVLGTGSVSLATYYNQSYMLIGKTVTYAIYLSLTVAGGPNAIKIALPAGVVATNYAGTSFFYGATAGMLAVLQSDGFLYLYVNAAGSTVWPNGTYTCVGTLSFQMT